MPKRLIRREFWERPVIITRAVFITGGVAVTVSLLAVIAGAVWVAVQLDDQAERRTELALQVTREQDERIETNRKTLARLEALERPPTQAETTRSVPAPSSSAPGQAVPARVPKDRAQVNRGDGGGSPAAVAADPGGQRGRRER